MTGSNISDEYIAAFWAQSQSSISPHMLLHVVSAPAKPLFLNIAKSANKVLTSPVPADTRGQPHRP